MEKGIIYFLLTMASIFMCQSACSQVLIGDANNDGNVSVADISTVISHILGESPQTFNADAADYNSDGTITITDISEIVKHILTTESSIHLI